MPVVLGTILKDWPRRIQTKQHDGMLGSPKSDTVSEVSIDIVIQPEVLSMHPLLSQLYIIMRKEKAPIYKSSRSTWSKHSKFAITDVWEEPGCRL